MKKILVSDYDDTFYINDEDVLKNVQLINKNKEKIMFIIATGRSYYDYIKKRDLYQIESEYVIINHGATVIKNDKIIVNHSIDNKIKKDIVKDLEIEKSINYFACSGKESRVNLQESNLTKINVNYDNKEIAINKYNELKEKYGKYINCFLITKNKAIEVVSKLSDKKNAILEIIKIENINELNVYTIGNGDTDYEMLNYFNGYMMEKSSPRIKMLNLESVDSVSKLIEILSK